MEVQKNQVPPLTIHMSELVWLTDNITRTALGPNSGDQLLTIKIGNG